MELEDLKIGWGLARLDLENLSRDGRLKTGWSSTRRSKKFSFEDGWQNKNFWLNRKEYNSGVETGLTNHEYKRCKRRRLSQEKRSTQKQDEKMDILLNRRLSD
jgi:hypothetical protein